MHQGPITIFDIAKEAGVSIATVSRALSSQYNPRSKKQQRVLEIARKYKYTPNVAARSLGSGKTRLLCIVLPELTNPYYSELYALAAKEAAAHGYALVMQRFQEGDDSVFLQALISRRPDGLILSGGLVEGPQTPEKALILEALGHYMPVVILGQAMEGFPCVSVHCNLEESARKSVRHLYSLGHTRIAMLGGTSINRSSSDRELGYYEEMTALGLSASLAYRHKSGYRAEDGAVGVLTMLSGLSREDWPTALITVNDLVALGALRQLERMGLRVPEDMAIVGCDNQFYAPYTHPPLTTIDLNLPDQARLSVQYLLAHEPGAAFQHEVDSALVLRDSCGSKLGGRSL